jgi:hypothetical protein
MPEVNLIDRSYNRDHSGHQTLCLQTDRSGLSFTVYDEKNRDFVVFRRYKFENVVITGDHIRQIIAVLDRDELLNLPFHSVRFLAYSQQSTLVPADYFDSERLEDYVQFNLGSETEGEYFTNHIHPADVYNVFVLPRALVSLVTLHFKKIDISSQATPFIWNATRNGVDMQQAGIHIGLNADFFDLAALGEGKLLLYNTFQYVSETDLLYYVVYVCKQLNLNMSELPLLLSGELSSRMAYFETLKAYFPETRYVNTSGNFQVATALLPVVSQKYLNLFNLRGCALSEEHIKAE